MNTITWSDFEKVEMRIGTIIAVNDFPEARKPAYQLMIDFGTEVGVKKTSAQITKCYTKDYLLNKQIVAVVNFPAKQIGKFMSECLVLGSIGSDGHIVLLSSDSRVENGLKIG
ncbi:tRNA-binding protein [Flavobacterium psychrophilum]|uniref:Protein secretion chaperone CsaA n=2 Tax=Flavobacterium psychrophilum TaxID=96345 RepID=A6GX13_FLAPJ|nr:tRNA-binding protein [Flavobacterium psychrophilum]AIG29439.1 tRNA-binding protein [Flavobacterium psychrophilum]AIG31716.1 tRNA-binding protein [Flavobacterium psychrophilum]AIG33870.1 tRNA-binding protein [Flavobacterium psychrophilum]AIG36232.1 tRNA-binding protein [Flavobacterium psychrophilum]AIG38498.1 tRNA-binding protein [Flavobacterium psychrophilum]